MVLAAAVGAVGAAGTVGAQDGGNETGNASVENFYDPPADDPLNARFRDCCANTVDSTDGGVLNLNIVYGPADGETYDVEIAASGLSDDRVDKITFGNDTSLPPTDLDRTDIVGMNFTGVEAGEYDFTVSVVGEDATTTVPLEVTGEPSAEEPSNESAANETAEGATTANETTTNETTTNETANGTTSEPSANETEMGAENGTAMANGTANETTMGNGPMTNATDENVSIVVEPSAANASANHTVSAVVMGENATGNLTEVTVNYGESNASFGLVLSSLFSVTAGDTDATANATAATYGPNGQNLTIGFDESIEVSEGDQIMMTYGGVTNPPEAGNYTVGVAVNNGSFANTTLDVAEANESMMTTTGTSETETTGTETTEGDTTETTGMNGTTQGTDETTEGGATTAGNDGTTGGDGGETATDGGGGEQTTEAGGPGFTLIAGVVALLAAALVAARRD